MLPLVCHSSRNRWLSWPDYTRLFAVNWVNIRGLLSQLWIQYCATYHFPRFCIMHAEIKLTLLFDIVRTLEPGKGNTMLSTSHCEMVLMMIRMSKCSDRYVSVMLYAHTFVQSILVSLVIMDLAMSPRDIIIIIISGLDHYKCIVPLVADSSRVVGSGPGRLHRSMTASGSWFV